MDAATPPVSSTGILQNSAADGIYVQFGLNTSSSTALALTDAKQYSQIDLVQIKDGVKTVLDSSVGEVALASTEVYDVTFALYDISATEATIVVTVDDVEIFNEVTTDESLLSAEGYFGMGISGQVLLYLE